MGKINKNSEKKVSKITLAANQDMAVINNLHGRLKKCADRQVNVNLLAEKVESIDAATLQLLLSFVRQIRSNGNSVNWQLPSQTMLDSAGLIGVRDELF